MNIKRIGLKLSVLLYALQVASQDQKGFILKGTIEGLPDSTTVVLKRYRDTIARSVSIGNQFELKGQVDGTANYYYLAIDPKVMKRNSEALWLINSTMTLNGNMTIWPKLILEGSQPHQDFQEMKRVQIKSRKNGNEIEGLKKFVDTHLKSLYVPELVLKIAMNYRKGELDTLFTKLSSEAQKSFYGKRLASKLSDESEAWATMEYMLNTSQLPNFKFRNIRGDTTTVEKPLKGNQLILVDFWASWCSPCRGSIPDLKKIYALYKSRGFNIISISIDNNKKKWEEAIIEDNVPWLQLIDNVDFAVKKKLKISAIPAMILIDSDRRIIRSDYITSFKAINHGSLAPVHLDELLNKLLPSK